MDNRKSVTRIAMSSETRAPGRARVISALPKAKPVGSTSVWFFHGSFLAQPRDRVGDEPFRCGPQRIGKPKQHSERDRVFDWEASAP